jgi:hypothetical protein
MDTAYLFGHLRWEPNLLSLELPATLPAKRYDLRSGLQTKQLLSLRDRQRDVGLLDAGANLLPVKQVEERSRKQAREGEVYERRSKKSDRRILTEQSRASAA